jgi:hypothetical protein
MSTKDEAESQGVRADAAHSVQHAYNKVGEGVPIQETPVHAIEARAVVVPAFCVDCRGMKALFRPACGPKSFILAVTIRL